MRWLQNICVLGALAILTSAGPVNQDQCYGRDSQKVLQALSSIQASSFCSDYLGIKTLTRTVTSAATNVQTATVTKTSTCKVPVTATTTKVSTKVVSTTVTNTVSTTLPATTAHTTVTISTYGTFTSTITKFTSTCSFPSPSEATIERPIPPAIKRRVDIPKALQSYTKEQISTGCDCYLTSKAPKVVTKTATITAVQNKAATKVISITKPLTVDTVTVTSTARKLTIVTINTITTIKPKIQTLTATTTITTSTTTTTKVTTIPTRVSRQYDLMFSGPGCVYDGFMDAYKVDGPSYSDGMDKCACLCNGDFGDGSTETTPCTSILVFSDDNQVTTTCVRYAAPFDNDKMNCPGTQIWVAVYSKLLPPATNGNP